jgi:hypothetical protein
MSFTTFNHFGELYRAAFAETDEQQKSKLLQEAERIISSSRVELPDEAVFQAKAA